MLLQKDDFLAALQSQSTEPSIILDELWDLYQRALTYAAIRERSAHLLSEVMTTPVLTVEPNDSLVKVSQLLLEQRVSGFPVVQNDILVGIITEGDLLKTMGVTARIPKRSFLQKIFDGFKYTVSPQHLNNYSRVKEVMSSAVITAQPQDTLAYALNLLQKHQITRLVIVNAEKKVMGILTRSDILRFNAAAQQTTPLPPHVNVI